jgi:biotin synthase
MNNLCTKLLPQNGVGRPWSKDQARCFYDLPFNDLVFQSHVTHRENFDPNRIQLSKLLSIKTGGCSEDCSYCSQSSTHSTASAKASKLIDPEIVVQEARAAKASGATRYCMGAAWRNPKPCHEATLVAMIKGVKALGLETCMTLGMLSTRQASLLSTVGLDYYNHNINTSSRFYPEIATTHTFGDRLETLANVRAAGIKICCGGILGLGETVDDRIEMLVTLANLETPPESVPLNMLIPMPGSELERVPPIDPIAFVRTIALTRLLMPHSHIRLTAGRTLMSDEMQAICFFAGANSIFIGDYLLTVDNPSTDHDTSLLNRLGFKCELNN